MTWRDGWSKGRRDGQMNGWRDGGKEEMRCRCMNGTGERENDRSRKCVC